jgi:hypothetical protein
MELFNSRLEQMTIEELIFIIIIYGLGFIAMALTPYVVIKFIETLRRY